MIRDLSMAALSLVAAVSVPQTSPQMNEPAERNTAVAKLNQLSLSAIESSWLSLPNICKARAFNAEPVASERLPLDPEILDIYSAAT